MNSHLHVVFEDVSSSRHIYDVVDDEFAESCKQISPFVESLNLVGFVLLISLYRQDKYNQMKWVQNIVDSFSNYVQAHLI